MTVSPPDTLGPQARVQLVADLLTDLQSQAFRIGLMRCANGHELDDAIPGNEEEETYAARLKRLEEGQVRLCEEYDGYMDAVRLLIDGANANGAPHEQ